MDESPWYVFIWRYDGVDEIEEIEKFCNEQLMKVSTTIPFLTQALTRMAYPASFTLSDASVNDESFRLSIKTLKSHLESVEVKLSKAEEEATAGKLRLEDAERRRREAEKRAEEMEAARREEIKEQAEIKSKLTSVMPLLQKFTGYS